MNNLIVITSYRRVRKAAGLGEFLERDVLALPLDVKKPELTIVSKM
jgi:hypothetical protein